MKVLFVLIRLNASVLLYLIYAEIINQRSINWIYITRKSIIYAASNYYEKS